MENICSIIKVIVSDKIIFPLFELAFFGIFLFALAREHIWFQKKTGVEATVKRGDKSWNYFYIAFGITSVVLMQVINSSETWIGYKTIISILNLYFLVYLAFYSSWFRNKIVGLIIKSKEKEEI